MSINTAVIDGNLVADPEIKMVGKDGDFAIVNLRIANNYSKKQADGSYADEASFFNVTVLGKFGELVDRKARKGDKVTCQGRLEQQRWEAQDGTKREKVVLIASEVSGDFIYRKNDEVPAKAEGSSSSSAPLSDASQQTLAADDDIPF